MKILLVLFSILSLFAFFASANRLPFFVHFLCSKGYDKHAHFAVFCVLQIFCVFAFQNYTPLSIAAILTLAGISIEIGQHCFTERTGDIMDVFADMAGILAALFLTQLFNIFKISIT